MKMKMNTVDGGVGEIDLTQGTVTLTDENGRLVTLDLGPADVHIESGLASYCAGYKLMDGIADLVCPVVPVPKASDKFWTWDQKDAFQDVEALVTGSTDNPQEVSPRLGNTLFTTKPYCLAAPVPVELIANADAPVRPEIAAIRRVMNALALARERRTSALLMATGSWGSGRYGAVSAKWNGGANSDPIKDIYTGIEASLTPVNQLVMSERTYHDFVQNAAVQKYVASKTSVTPIAASNNKDASNLTALLGLPPVVIGAMKGTVTNTTTFGYVWGDNVALCYNEPGVPADGQTINTAKTMRWTGADSATPDGAPNGGFLVRKYFDPRRGARGAYVYVVVVNDAEVMTSTLAGYLLTGAHA
jgi:hypothetical protein